MKSTLIILTLLLASCKVTGYDIEHAQAICAPHGGIYALTSVETKDAKAVCQDGHSDRLYR